VEAGKSMENSLKQSIKKELGLAVRVGREMACVDHVYTHFRLTLYAYDVILWKGEPESLGCGGWQWTTPEDVAKLPLSKIDRTVIAALAKGQPL